MLSCLNSATEKEIFMSALLEEWKPRLAELPQHDRAELAHFLLASLRGKSESGVDSWSTEIEQRLDEVVPARLLGFPSNR
jgi:putative addiction module component